MNTIVTETSDDGDISVNVYHKLADQRILFLCGFIDDSLATGVVASLLLKDAEDSDKKITLFINSEGGDIRNILMIHDMMKLTSAPIETICIGSAMDEVAILLSAGTPGMRMATKNSVISVGQLVGEWVNTSDLTDAKIILDQTMDDNKRMMEILAKSTGKTIKQITTDFDRRVFMTAQQAMKYNLIDKVVGVSK